MVQNSSKIEGRREEEEEVVGANGIAKMEQWNSFNKDGWNDLMIFFVCSRY